jgi:hypothetical protein
MDAMKAGAARLEAAYAGTTGGWQTRVTQGVRAPRASARVLTVNDVSLCETASSHTGIQVDGIRFTQNGAVRTFVEHGIGQHDRWSAQRFSLGPRPAAWR